VVGQGEMKILSNNKICFKKFNKRNISNSDIVIGILNNFKEPVSFHQLHLLSGIRKDKLSQVLASLSRYGTVRKVYCRKTSFWRLENDRV